MFWIKLPQKKTVRIKQNTEPWITPEIREKIALRDGLFYMYKEYLDTSMKAHYNKVRNEIQRDIREAKS